MTPVLAYIGIGANLETPRVRVLEALEALAGLPHTRLLRQSSLYRSPPMGPVDQPDYINAVAELETRLAPAALLQALLELERRHGRVRDGERWGPRTLDLDILLYGDRIIDEPHLTVPHSGMQARAFVLYPLAEIAPDLWIPDLGALEGLLARCPRNGLERLVEESG
ncbi:2-amino-4-hydroxy-6-hydroxymethyldihydropteridine diphosphokinase [Ectothiorhodospira lacustris]|uniref:2-amino-4-hydroxy-6- hydroxymethyldihydropteridine diphosphokinase n=1 Tax=Ectothiorhodospira lacustris TaxID=2899127 RepID=UPI001EE9AE57|nr:2-amino-4-hydroxy-6-hydroxymethyldihydropteridine diphosphokinase [Ectothiorhodospira lacustris]MCG5500183.1 2-amino-4-hydroxy-6-hydroxymethyldihydropteridine diphosphokinase [Ectothiorhodospira lacustris]MCG5511318.1 2-amino-4-hydroxy-6-hydroxymethyldihydropteridine diphosphokinase [Ectothiorhodospira lacustris]MCG5523046.1 2-amino-4-hydroxy-6-hydroxymethyldihydropteridine diphosphokinase [Ectothiorhodospira lacustris]